MDPTHDIIHPIFDACKSFTLDPYWKEVFSNFARNRFPQGVRYDAIHRTIVLRMDANKKPEVIALSDKPTETFQTMMRILREILGMRSARDLKLQREQMEDANQKRLVDLKCEWKKIKPKNVKDQLIMDYITRLNEEYKLTTAELKQLIAIVQLGFQFHCLTSDSVVYVDGRVEKIEDLEFDPDTRIFTIPDPPASSLRSEKQVRCNRFYTAIDRFVKDNSVRIDRLG